MNEKEQKKIIKRIDKELKNFRDEILKDTKEDIYSDYYRIHAYNEMAEFIKNNVKEYEYIGFPEDENILDTLYSNFLGNDFDLTQDGLRFFISGEIECNVNHYKLEHKQEETLTEKLDKFLAEYAPYDRFDETETLNSNATSLELVKECLASKNGTKFIIKYLNEIIDDSRSEEIVNKAKDLKKQVKALNEIEM